MKVHALSHCSCAFSDLRVRILPLFVDETRLPRRGLVNPRLVGVARDRSGTRTISTAGPGRSRLSGSARIPVGDEGGTSGRRRSGTDEAET
jgi:hypothetical protein